MHILVKGEVTKGLQFIKKTPHNIRLGTGMHLVTRKTNSRTIHIFEYVLTWLVLVAVYQPNYRLLIHVCVCVCVCLRAFDSPDMANRDSNVNTLCT